MYIVYIMNKTSLFLVILFITSILFLYSSSTNTFRLKGESSIVSYKNKHNINDILTSDTALQQSEYDINEKRQNISSYDQKTNNSYEVDLQQYEEHNIDKESIHNTLKPYSPDIFNIMHGSELS